MGNLNEKIIDILTEEFSLKKWQIENTIELIDDGNTIPFIARYRKERTVHWTTRSCVHFLTGYRRCALLRIENQKSPAL